MQLIITHRAPHLGAAGTSIDLTLSQAIYERLRGHVVEPTAPPPSPKAEASKPRAAKVSKEGPALRCPKDEEG
ncbi:hypothetical protein EOA27_14360 [Mesorhizobium sp. M2A.F.Ca.ET.037.01.1.1]|uniref:hypothetical protein n=1 Tax=unclassified Mesorhizobium TaxID=325217 RepID=UPI000F759F34|nr:MULTISPECIES: hypothetical protein [unclassified Mesorhizobium]RUY05733.1 hypothetical protein EOA25_17070 [Mesorhizobium sp. M2A.F.Ca.ET.040.01.1.1]RVC66680.1 hypothetical protein EN759_18015 [Mesorhizobium sp. M00.F.Ca.ET.038.03.1.1]RVC67339.1 hypothetical protein EN766_31820 [Mesorhizobium sp. M2A.F.Ca.ET.046.02.1.1]AZO38759.1 hypothetical protein EJ072_33100 [Mesorhizobium sp. M2A.F.Ca.ET.046.03.2.1]RUX17730.1 hypothetical protein EOA27_14360 [Mesorhizobium sp. M2A.F.Ca.ET.037.01.1.1]